MLLPVKWVLRAFSSITQAVILMVMLALFGVAASIPMGILAMIPTWGFYSLTLLAVVGVLAGVPAYLLYRLLMKAGSRFSAGLSFSAVLISFVVLSVGAVAAWQALVWPQIYYDAGTGKGVRFFGYVIEYYATVPIRRLPWMEMSELEFYAWWPLNTILYLFVTTMVVTTIRRIEFTVPNIGVLTVHSGIIVLAMGSAYYSIGKQEGDTLLVSGPIDNQTGEPTIGPPVEGFYDNTRTVLRVRQQTGRLASQWDQRPLVGIPRFNEYNVQVLASEVGVVEQKVNAPGDRGRTLDLPVQSFAGGGRAGIDAEISLRLVGYVPNAELQSAWRPIRSPADRWTALPAGLSAGETQSPMRTLRFIQRVGDKSGTLFKAESGEKPVESSLVDSDAFPLVAAERVVFPERFNNLLAVEYTRGMPASRWQELLAVLPVGAVHGLIVELPDLQLARVYAIEVGKTVEVGTTPENTWKLTVEQISPTPLLNIITPGFEGAQSSQLVVKVVPPAALAGKGNVPQTFRRHIYHRFSELSQDLLEQTHSDGQPIRQAPTEAIKLSYIDSSIIQVYIDEQPGVPGPSGVVDNENPVVRAIVRTPGKEVAVFTALSNGSRVPIGDPLHIEFGERWSDVERVIVPIVTPLADRRKDDDGVHKKAAVAIEVTTGPLDKPTFRRVVWLPFVQYQGFAETDVSTIVLPPTSSGPRSLDLVFGRLWRPLPGMALQLAQFEMIPYPHSTQPRDYRSEVRVLRGPQLGTVMNAARVGDPNKAIGQAEHAGLIDAQIRATSLNDPLLQSPFIWNEQSNIIANSAGWLASRLGPSQFKFSQSGWDSTGWTESQAAVARGELKQPFARFTILGVGNNPGIYIIAFGAVLMSLGIPWAFYFKPYLVRRQKAKFQRLVAEGKITPRAQRLAGPDLREVLAIGPGAQSSSSSSLSSSSSTASSPA